MKNGDIAYAAVDEDGYILGHHEGILISDDLEFLRRELDCWDFCLPDRIEIRKLTVSLTDVVEVWSKEKAQARKEKAKQRVAKIMKELNKGKKNEIL